MWDSTGGLFEICRPRMEFEFLHDTLQTNVHLRVGLSIDFIDCVWCDLFVCLLCVFCVLRVMNEDDLVWDSTGGLFEICRPRMEFEFLHDKQTFTCVLDYL